MRSAVPSFLPAALLPANPTSAVRELPPASGQDVSALAADGAR